MSNLPPPPPPPSISEYELSHHTAIAGALARQEAANLPGDPAQLGALMRAAEAQAPVTREHAEIVNGLPLYPLNFAVTLATTELGRVSEKLGDKPSELQTFMRLLVCFYQPSWAYQMLQSGEGALPAMDAEGLKLAGGWGVPEMTAFGSFIARMKARSPSTQTPASPPASPPGKSKLGGKARR